MTTIIRRDVYWLALISPVEFGRVGVSEISLLLLSIFVHAELVLRVRVWLLIIHLVLLESSASFLIDREQAAFGGPVLSILIQARFVVYLILPRHGRLICQSIGVLPA